MGIRILLLGLSALKKIFLYKSEELIFLDFQDVLLYGSTDSLKRVRAVKFGFLY
jgi:hypothetical protein